MGIQPSTLGISWDFTNEVGFEWEFKWIENQPTDANWSGFGQLIMDIWLTNGDLTGKQLGKFDGIYDQLRPT